MITLFPATCFLLILFQVGGNEAQQDEVQLTREIPLHQLRDYVENENGRNILKEDFKRVRMGQRKPWTVASLPENLPKNRYDDLLAYDETRVVLEPLPGDPNSDYINANYIDGYYLPTEYVATQGPLPNTVNDFWRMIWQLNARKIVMLANVIEHGEIKVEKYWPDTNGSYGDITVRKLSEHSIEDHVIRTFLLQKAGDDQARIVRQFHYTGWPDFGVPADKLSLVALVKQARKYLCTSTAPLVIHCSAGVGRTGTVILLDSVMEEAKYTYKADFLKRLNHMRNQRIDVVEKEIQYIFAHEAVHQVLNNRTASNERLMYFDEKYREIDAVDANNNENEPEQESE